ncbi:unnamed protein product [Owenia fusiformis]|uniref:Uncharacterized protein n=1 Tax=Owenia fusiformis TaxID=6347 RepID=A0A8J1Y4V8_OWEFU|nr:unnamed protein product [Owenia fusiformis]
MAESTALDESCGYLTPEDVSGGQHPLDKAQRPHSTNGTKKYDSGYSDVDSMTMETPSGESLRTSQTQLCKPKPRKYVRDRNLKKGDSVSSSVTSLQQPQAYDNNTHQLPGLTKHHSNNNTEHLTDSGNLSNSSSSIHDNQIKHAHNGNNIQMNHLRTKESPMRDSGFYYEPVILGKSSQNQGDQNQHFNGVHGNQNFHHGNQNFKNLQRSVSEGPLHSIDEQDSYRATQSDVNVQMRHSTGQTPRINNTEIPLTKQRPSDLDLRSSGRFQKKNLKNSDANIQKRYKKSSTSSPDTPEGGKFEYDIVQDRDLTGKPHPESMMVKGPLYEELPPDLRMRLYSEQSDAPSPPPLSKMPSMTMAASDLELTTSMSDTRSMASSVQSNANAKRRANPLYDSTGDEISQQRNSTSAASTVAIVTKDDTEKPEPGFLCCKCPYPLLILVGLLAVGVLILVMLILSGVLSPSAPISAPPAAIISDNMTQNLAAALKRIESLEKLYAIKTTELEENYDQLETKYKRLEGILQSSDENVTLSTKVAQNTIAINELEENVTINQAAVNNITADVMVLQAHSTNTDNNLVGLSSTIDANKQQTEESLAAMEFTIAELTAAKLTLQDSISALNRSLLQEINKLRNGSQVSPISPAPSQCRYKKLTHGSPVTVDQTQLAWQPVNIEELNSWVTTGATCSTIGGLRAQLESTNNETHRQYRCTCTGDDDTSNDRFCLLHFWQCPKS